MEQELHDPLEADDQTEAVGIQRYRQQTLMVGDLRKEEWIKTPFAPIQVQDYR